MIFRFRLGRGRIYSYTFGSFLYRISVMPLGGTPFPNPDPSVRRAVYKGETRAVVEKGEIASPLGYKRKKNRFLYTRRSVITNALKTLSHASPCHAPSTAFAYCFECFRRRARHQRERTTKPRRDVVARLKRPDLSAAVHVTRSSQTRAASVTVVHL